MTITEKELAEKLQHERVRQVEEEGLESWEAMARRAADLLGVTLAPEKPEPGLYLNGHDWIAVDPNGDQWVIFKDGSGMQMASGIKKEADPAKLTPARVVSEADLLEAEKYRDALAMERDQWKAAARAEADEVDRLATAEPVELTHDEVDAIWEEVDGHAPAPIGVRLTVNAALAKHGHGRALPGREEVEDALLRTGFGRDAEDRLGAASTIQKLLGGGDRG